MELVQSGRLDDFRRPDFSDYRADVDNFYRPFGIFRCPPWLFEHVADADAHD